MKNLIFISLFIFVLGVSNLIAQTLNSGVVNGKAVNLVKPDYPDSAKSAGANGQVNVQVTIDQEGKVINAKAVSGHELLRKSAETAALSSTFSPTKLNDQPVIVTGVIIYNFVAANSANKDIINGGVVNGKAKLLPKPTYPNEAKTAKAQGTVMVEIIINEKGNVISANAVSGHELLRKESEKAALKAKFPPTKLKGKLVKMKGVLVYNFYVQ